jgi:hypothetical protein
MLDLLGEPREFDRRSADNAAAAAVTSALKVRLGQVAARAQ